MRGKLRRWWPVLKALLCLAILVAIGRQFAADLRRPELYQRPLHLGWLALSGLLYLLGLGLSALYWRRLLGHLGNRPPLAMTLRAYFIGQLGKYLPGKAWALLLRAEYVRPGGVGLGVATLTAFYEVLTTMASGCLLAAVLFAALGPEGGSNPTAADLRGLLSLRLPESGVLGWEAPVLVALALFAATGLPLLPGLFNRVVHRLTLPFRGRDDPVPTIRLAYLGEGLLMTTLGWCLMGGALGAALRGVLGADLAWTPAALARLPAALAVSYVAGFVILVAPAGLGVREFFLTLLLAPELAALGEMGEPAAARAAVVLAVLALRLAWTAAELLLAGLLYFGGVRPLLREESGGLRPLA
jgi:uncharacterized membrane protein YbhN (UPF0104 family)